MLWFFLSFLWLADLQVYGKQHSLYDYGFKLDNLDEFNLENFLPADRLTYLEIKQSLDKNSSYEVFLEFLESRAPYLFENFVLLHHSGSLQSASYEKPRVLLFGGGLVLALSEHGSGRLQPKVEIIEFDANDFEFKFHELVFHSMEALDDKEATSLKSVEFVDSPTTCATCHGSPGRPIWNPYDFWPKAYGSLVSRFRSDEELQRYNLFKTHRQGGVYARLNFFQEDRVNSLETFTQYLNQLNYLTISKELQKDYESLRPFMPFLLAGLNHCFPVDSNFEQNVASFLPAGVLASLPYRFKQVFQATRTRHLEVLDFLDQQYEGFFPNFSPYYDSALDRLIEQDYMFAFKQFVFVNLGIQWSSFMMSQGDNRFSTGVPLNPEKDFSASLYFLNKIDYLGLNPKLNPVRAFTWIDFDCDTLQKESIARLSQLQEDYLEALKHSPLSLNSPEDARSTLGMCLECHSIKASKNSEIPYIPFEDQAKLKAWLKEGGYQEIEKRTSSLNEDKMPPNVNLSLSERGNLLKVLRSIIGQ